MATMTAEQLIRLSAREHRTATEYPTNIDEYDAIVDALRVECDADCDPEEHSGAGYSGPEARGFVRYWGETESGHTWQVEVVRPEGL